MKLFQWIEISKFKKKKKKDESSMSSTIFSFGYTDMSMLTKFYKSSRFSKLSKLSINNAAAEKKKRGGE